MSQPPYPSTPQSSTRLNVLIVDDGRASADVLGMFFEIEGHRVKVAYDGETGLGLLDEFSPDLVVLDLNLPGMSGFEVAEEIRRRPGGVGIQLHALSGAQADVEGPRVLKAGFDGFLSKPVAPGDLRSLLDGVIANIGAEA
ncbi:response regulator [Luteolibacter marinus]|uniref:response regulator n=1 Tax=Luteolibacter marinus TaxID=2776705 RepID=UPI001868AA3E|nr:response regulator [Luteolibacter marinus]